LQNLYQVAYASLIVVVLCKGVIAYKATTYYLIVLKTIKKIMLIDESNLSTKEIVINICDIYLLVDIAKTQFKVDNLIDLRSLVTSRIVI